MILCNYLPLIRDFIPSAAAEIESDIHAYMSKQGGSFQFASQETDFLNACLAFFSKFSVIVHKPILCEQMKNDYMVLV